MDAKEFKRLFGEIATANGFTAAHGGWFRESPEAIVVLDLQKSNFGNHFELNMKAFIQGIFGNRVVRSKELVKKLPGDVFLRPPERYKASLGLEQEMTRDQRRDRLETLFREFLNPICTDALSRTGLASLDSQGVVRLLPAIRRELASFGHNDAER